MKIFRVILLNFVVIFLLFFAVEVYLNVKEFSQTRGMSGLKTFSKPYLQDFLHIMHDYYLDFENAFTIREPYVIPGTPDVLFMGCSYTYGMNLEENETPHAVYSKVFGVSTYNWGRPATSPREMLALLRYNLYNLPNQNNVRCVIYTYIIDHKRRLFDDMCKYRYDFKENNGRLEKKFFIPFIMQLKTIRAIRQLIYYKFNNGDCGEKAQKLMALYMQEIYREIESKFRFGEENTKFIILIYNEDVCDEYWENIIGRYENVKIIKISDLLNFDYTTEAWTNDSSGHPNSKFWQVLMSELYKKF